MASHSRAMHTSARSGRWRPKNSGVHRALSTSCPKNQVRATGVCGRRGGRRGTRRRRSGSRGRATPGRTAGRAGPTTACDPAPPVVGLEGEAGEAGDEGEREPEQQAGEGEAGAVAHAARVGGTAVDASAGRPGGPGWPRRRPGRFVAGDAVGCAVVRSRRWREVSTLCRRCGLCCDGSLFDSVPLTAEEAARGRARGLVIVARSDGSPALQQRCAALGERGCGVYVDRTGALSRVPLHVADGG
jgi:hypothetical protein